MSAARTLLLIPLAIVAIAAAPGPSFEVDGMRVAVAIDGNAGSAETRLAITLTDVATGAPVRGAHPLGWLASIDPAAAAATGTSGAACDRLIGSFVQGGLASRARADFNTMRILSLTDRNDLIALNPAVSLGGTQIEQVLHLAGPAEASAISPDGSRLAVAVRESSSLTIVDSRTLKAVREVALDEPALQLAWRGTQLIAASAASLFVIADGRSTMRVETRLGGAPDMLAAGDHALLVARDRDVMLVDPTSAAIVGRFRAPGPLASVRFSALADSFLLLGADGVLTVLDRVGHPLAVHAPAPLAAIEPVGAGRQWLAISRDGRDMLLLDGASGAERARTALSGAMDRIQIGDHYAYVHSATSDTVDLADLSRLASGELNLVTVPMSEKEAAADFGSGARIAMLPGGAVVASPSGRGLAYYVEGMMAPMGSIPHYGMATRGLFAVNDNLSEQAPGVYTATTRYRRGGAMLLPLLLDRPRAARCLPVELPLIAAAPGHALSSYAIAIAPQHPRPLTPVALSLSVVGQAPPERLRLLISGDGNWQRRLIATRDGAGHYVATVRFPVAGLYQVTADAPAIGHHFGDQRFDIMVEAQP